MIFLKNRLVFGTIKRIIKMVFSVAYKIIKAFNLHLTLFVLLLGMVLAILGVIEKGSLEYTLFLVALGLTVVYAVVKTIKTVFGIKPKNGKVKIIKADDKTQSVQEQGQAFSEQYQQPVQEVQEKPTYYTVKNNPSYVYAEYSDRYELFLKTSSGLKRVRVDHK